MSGLSGQGTGVTPHAGPGLYIYATLVSRHEPGKVLTSAVQGYRFANSEDEARGMAVAYTVGAKPDFGIDQVLVMRVADDDVRAAAAAIDRDPQGRRP